MTDKITNNPVIAAIQQALAGDAVIKPAEEKKIAELFNKATSEERSGALQFLNETCKTNGSACSLFKDYSEKRNADRRIAENSGLFKLIKEAGSKSLNIFGPGVVPQQAPLQDDDFGSSGGVGGLGALGFSGSQTGSGLGLGGIGLYGKRENRDKPIDLGGHGIGMERIIGSDSKGGLSKDVIGRILHRGSWAKIKYAYEKALDRNPNLEGRVVSKFSIDPNGQVTNAQVTSDTIKDQQMLNEIKAILEQIRFPKPEGGGFVDVKHPFVFEVLK